MRSTLRLAVPLAVAALGVSVLPAVAAGRTPALPGSSSSVAALATGAAGEQAGTFDYTQLAPVLSQPVYPKTVREVRTITAHDGEQIYLEIVRPDPAVYPETATGLPVVLEASPYHGTIADRDGTRMFPDPTDTTGQKMGLTGYFAQRGYGVVMMDLRGTGRSTGCLDHLGQNDAKDLTTVIETLAAEDWTNGRIGMTGHSYVGSTPSVAAAVAPKGLVTIAPSAGLASMYDHQFNKGIPWNLQYIGPMVAYEGLALDRDLPPGTPSALGDRTGDNAGNGPNPQTGCGLPNSAALAGTGQVTGQYELWHAQRDWGKRAAAADIPIFMIHGVNDNAARIPAAEWFFGERFGREGDKVWVGQWDHGSTNGRCGSPTNARVLHPTCRFDQMQYALHAWFDKHLMLKDVPTGPAVEAFLNGEAPLNIAQVRDPQTWGTKVATRDAWSRPTTRLQLFPDARDGSLRLTPPDGAGSRSFNGGVNAVIAASNGAANRLTFTTPEGTFTEDTVLLGLPELVLRASQSLAQVNHLTATLYRVDASGNREIANVCGIQPMLRFGVQTLAPVVPGQAMDLPMQCFTAAHWVKAGQRLQLEIGTRTVHHASFASDPQITVFTGPGATRYSLPTVQTVLTDDVRLRDGGTPDGAPGSTGAAVAESGAVTFSGLAKDAILVP
ncbi:MAG TPA: CocE/NonD family hydrolase [Mycobacteriales bacterium]|nr:CocE/NonD family hydrolase [Mycobacteriales bacterium]